jgi:hypothetical protein
MLAVGLEEVMCPTLTIILTITLTLTLTLTGFLKCTSLETHIIDIGRVNY